MRHERKLNVAEAARSCGIGPVIRMAAIALLSIASVQADENHPKIQFVETKVVDGYFIGVTDELGSTNTPINRRLCFSIWTTNRMWVTNDYSVVFPTQPESAFQLELLDTNGVIVPKTEAGKKVGTRFQDFNAGSFVLKATGPGPRNGIKSQKTLVAEKVWPYEILILFRPSDLFRIERHGSYTLRIRFQIVALAGAASPNTNNAGQLIRFPPLDYPLMLAGPDPRAKLADTPEPMHVKVHKE
jgi:hypothetical protein